MITGTMEWQNKGQVASLLKESVKNNWEAMTDERRIYMIWRKRWRRLRTIVDEDSCRRYFRFFLFFFFRYRIQEKMILLILEFRNDDKAREFNPMSILGCSRFDLKKEIFITCAMRKLLILASLIFIVSFLWNW